MRKLLLADPEQGGAGSAICFCQVPAIDQISCLLSLHAHWLAYKGHQAHMLVLCAASYSTPAASRCLLQTEAVTL